MFKVRDIVKGTNNSDYGVTNEYMYKGKIVRIRDNGNIDIEILEHKLKSEIGERYDDLDPKYFELVEEYKYTYEDLKKSPIGTKVMFENGKILIKLSDKRYDNEGCWREESGLEKMKDIVGNFGKIVKIEEPTYTTVYEYKPEILDEAEKRYLRNIIRPFRDKVKTIKKGTLNINDEQYISINFENTANNFALPNFKKGTMYKGMGVDKKYTLEELGL